MSSNARVSSTLTVGTMKNWIVIKVVLLVAKLGIICPSWLAMLYLNAIFHKRITSL